MQLSCIVGGTQSGGDPLRTTGPSSQRSLGACNSMASLVKAMRGWGCRNCPTACRTIGLGHNQALAEFVLLERQWHGYRALASIDWQSSMRFSPRSKQGLIARQCTQGDTSNWPKNSVAPARSCYFRRCRFVFRNIGHVQRRQLHANQIV